METLTRHGGRAAAAAAFLSILAGLALAAAPAQATPLAASLTATNGEGTFDPTIGCPAGDGPSWRYAYSGIAAPVTGPFGGTWNSTIEVHDAGNGGAFIPAGTGRLKVDVDRGGVANLEFDGGSCASAPLALGTQADGDPVVSGTLPTVATGGTGVLRGFTGSGTVNLTLELGPGADNVAQVDVAGNFTVLQPNLALGAASAFWRNVSEYLQRKLTVTFFVRNVGEVVTQGDAFGVAVTDVDLAGRDPLGGLPKSVGRLNPGQQQLVGFQFPNAKPGQTYNLNVRIEGTDALDAPVAPVTQTVTVKAPPLP